MGKSIHINSKLIIPIVLVIAIVILLSMLFYFEMRMLDRVVLPFLITFIFSIVIYYLLYINFKDKFISKIFIISVFFHFAFILFWQLLKYYGIGLQIPTDNIFEGYISDVDGVHYHAQAVEVKYYLMTHHFGVLKRKLYGGFFSKLIGIIYSITGKSNPFYISCLNSISAGFIAPIIYYLGKVTLKDISVAKIYSLLFVITITHIMNTSVLMRDVYIALFIYLSILLSYLYYKTRNLLFLMTTLLSIYCIHLFRPYASYIVFMAIIFSSVIYNIKIVKQRSFIKVNKITMALIILSPALLILLSIIFVKLTHSFGTISSAEDLINVRNTDYVGSNSDYDIDFVELYNIFPLLPFMIGTICLFLAPFPWEWVIIRRIMFVPDVLMLYCFLSSFFKNIRLVFKDKNFILTVFIFIMIIQFSIYCITVGNSGSIQRLRSPFIPMIYLIAMYRPDKYLGKLIKTIQNWRLV